MKMLELCGTQIQIAICMATANRSVFVMCSTEYLKVHFMKEKRTKQNTISIENYINMLRCFVFKLFVLIFDIEMTRKISYRMCWRECDRIYGCKYLNPSIHVLR